MVFTKASSNCIFNWNKSIKWSLKFASYKDVSLHAKEDYIAHILRLFYVLLLYILLLVELLIGFSSVVIGLDHLVTLAISAIGEANTSTFSLWELV